MQHFTELTNLHLGKTWLTIGSFDGVHIGHQYLIKKLVAGAHENGASAVVLTFHPHPAIVLRGRNDPFYLTSSEEKQALLANLGLDACITMKFDLAVASYNAQYFIQLLSRQMKLERLMVGQGFALGRGRTGDTLMLSHIGGQLGFEVEVLLPIQNDDLPASSSQIRQYIIDRNIAGAARMLGRNYSISGIVAHGDGRGRDLGFPTANIATSQMRLLPGSGVYACYAESDGHRYQGVANIGVRPTFNLHDPSPHLEVHILDFDREIYGEMINVEFIQHLRNEIKFSSIAELTRQIQVDVEITKASLK